MSEQTGAPPRPYRTIDEKEARQLVQVHGGQWADEIEFKRPEYSDDGDGETWTIQLYEDGLVVDGNFAVRSDTVLVRGDLVVRGTLSDCGDVDHTLLVVLGDLRVERALIVGELVVTGSLIVEDAFYAASGNDYAVVIGGDAEAKGFIEEGTSCRIRGTLRARRVLSLQNAIVHGPSETEVVKRRALPTDHVLRRELLRDGYPDIETVRAAFEAGSSILVRD